MHDVPPERRTYGAHGGGRHAVHAQEFALYVLFFAGRVLTIGVRGGTEQPRESDDDHDRFLVLTPERFAHQLFELFGSGGRGDRSTRLEPSTEHGRSCYPKALPFCRVSG